VARYFAASAYRSAFLDLDECTDFGTGTDSTAIKVYKFGVMDDGLTFQLNILADHDGFSLAGWFS
jgi:hypothetical protein